MKKYILTIALAIGFGMNLNAQIGQSGKSDSFFSSNKYSEYRDEIAMGTMPLLPGHNTTFDYDADPKPTPVGSGLLLLAGMGLAYGVKRKLKDEN